jgi:tetratricopeptide (TPR) repeat protein
MGLFDWFRNRGPSPPPDDLLAALIDGFERQDAPRLMQLINENSETIRAEFKSWTTPPEGTLQDPAAMDRYAKALYALATLFENSGDRSLKDWLAGRGRENPLAQWSEALERADGLLAAGQAAAAVELLRATLDQIKGVTGSGVGYFRARALGRLGLALGELGDVPEAVRATREALELCAQAEDLEGVQAYTQYLHTLEGHAITDAASNDRFSVVFIDSEGRSLVAEELAGAAGTIRWEVRYRGLINPEARRLHVKGRTVGGEGNHDEAIALFTEAAVLDPRWPYPVYDRAFGHLLKQEFDAALTDYRKTLELAPTGFFLAATAADMLSREAAGEFPPGSYAAFAMLEHMSVQEQRAVAEQLVQLFPSHAPAWELHARLSDDPSAKLAAIECGLQARPDPDTRGSLLVQKALALHAQGERERALEILQPLTASIGDSLTSHAKAYIATAIIQSTGRNEVSPQ